MALILHAGVIQWMVVTFSFPYCEFIHVMQVGGNASHFSQRSESTYMYCNHILRGRVCLM